MKSNEPENDALLSEQRPTRDEEPPPESGVYEVLVWHLTIIWNLLARCVYLFVTDIGIVGLFEKLARKVALHPLIALCISTAILCVALPTLIIILCMFATVFLTFSGLVFLEGTLISITSVLLFGCLGAILIIFLFFSFVTLAGFFGFMHIYDLFRGIHNKSAITDYLNRERRTVAHVD